MNDRILGALQRVGVQDSPVASLDHDQQFFALTAQTLLYQGSDSGTLHQVKLREISRIHSDHQGTLRVEAPSGTAITASLLGFDPNRVQRFFQTVRDTTARAKQLPASPLPTAPGSSGAKTFSPASPAPVAPAPGGPNLSPSNPAPASAAPKPAATPAPADPAPVSPVPSDPAKPIVIGDGPEAPRVVNLGAPPAGLGASASPAAAPAQPTPPKPELSKPEAVRPEPVRIEPIRVEASKPVSVSASPTFNQPRDAGTPKASTPAPSLPPTRLPVSTPVKPASPASSSPVTSSPIASNLVTSGPATSQTSDPVALPAPTTALERSLQSSSLVRSAQTVGGLSLTVRILSIVLVLGALGMGYFLWRQGRASQIPALWTVTMGIVTAVALNVLAEVLRLLSALGQAVATRD